VRLALLKPRPVNLMCLHLHLDYSLILPSVEIAYDVAMPRYSHMLALLALALAVGTHVEAHTIWHVIDLPTGEFWPTSGHCFNGNIGGIAHAYPWRFLRCKK